jgi:hypothetical protein
MSKNRRARHTKPILPLFDGNTNFIFLLILPQKTPNTLAEPEGGGISAKEGLPKANFAR